MNTTLKNCPIIFSPTIEGQNILAPRGVSLSGSVLAVADTAQNRVLLWKNFSFDNKQNQEPDIVLGQIDLNSNGRNEGTSVHGGTMQYPSGIWTDGNKLIVADAWNHRVLIWHTLPVENGQVADVVIGQKDFTSNQPNIEGLAKSPSKHSLYWPYGVCSDGKSLWIADTGNRRVLFYETIPEKNYAPADRLIGQDSFEDREYNSDNAIWPYSVKISSKNALSITDTQYYRVLVWNNKEDAFSKEADVIVGQPDFVSNGQNQYRAFPMANTLNWCYDSCFYKDGLLVADTGNSRVLYWKNIPKENNMPACNVFGQINFETLGEASLSMKSGNDNVNEMYWPFAITTCNDQLVVADTGNHRILNYKI